MSPGNYRLRHAAKNWHLTHAHPTEQTGGGLTLSCFNLDGQVILGYLEIEDNTSKYIHKNVFLKSRNKFLVPLTNSRNKIQYTK